METALEKVNGLILIRIIQVSWKSYGQYFMVTAQGEGSQKVPGGDQWKYALWKGEALVTNWAQQPAIFRAVPLVSALFFETWPGLSVSTHRGPQKSTRAFGSIPIY